ETLRVGPQSRTHKKRSRGDHFLLFQFNSDGDIFKMHIPRGSSEAVTSSWLDPGNGVLLSV
ncbi:hypothetical protein M0804_001630, partial [Polistes exclamans]